MPSRTCAPRFRSALAGAGRSTFAAALRVEDGAEGRLGVEVKTDSAWSRGQLVETVPEDCHGVLLAVGFTALAVDDRDMAALDDYRLPWRRVGPDEFGRIVRDHADGDRELLDYADHLRREADAHESALQAVRDGQPVTTGRRPQVLGHWAYFGDVLRHREDIAEWQRKTLVSGPLVTRWIPERPDGTGDYLEFIGQGDIRSLCVKTYAPAGSGRLPAARERIRERLDGLPWRDSKAPSAKDKTCTAARFSLEELRPVEAAQLVEMLLDRLDT